MHAITPQIHEYPISAVQQPPHVVEELPNGQTPVSAEVMIYMKGGENLNFTAFSKEDVVATLAAFTIRHRERTVIDRAGHGLMYHPDDIEPTEHTQSVDFSNNHLKELPSRYADSYAMNYMNLSSNEFETFPEPLLSLFNTTCLNLAKNKIQSIPENIAFLAKLRLLDLSHNRLKDVVAEIGCISMLIMLQLSHNAIHSLPSTLGRCEDLTTLDLSHNNFQVFPEEVCSLGNLKYLHMNDNFLTEVPESVIELHSLEVFHLENNQLSYLTPKLGQLKRLKFLHLRGNAYLKALPIAFGRLLSIREISVEGTQINEQVSHAIMSLSSVKQKLTSLKIQEFSQSEYYAAFNNVDKMDELNEMENDVHFEMNKMFTHPSTTGIYAMKAWAVAAHYEFDSESYDRLTDLFKVRISRALQELESNEDVRQDQMEFARSIWKPVDGKVDADSLAIEV